MKLLFSVVTLALLLCGLQSGAQAESLKGCKLVSKIDHVMSGRFIWKPSAAHFSNRVAIVTPRYYYPIPPVVQLLQNKKGYPLIETADIKSTGQCAGNPECFFAASYLTHADAGTYNKKYHTVIVKVRPDSDDTSGKECRYYIIKNPTQRTEYIG
jgi:hypothetical protein